MATWITSDQHFGHRKVIEYCGRPFSDVEEMNKAIIERHNAIVKPEDTVWHLGDFALDDRLVKSFLDKLNGRKILIPGNHDKCHPCHSRHARALRKYKQYGFAEIYPNGYDMEFEQGFRIHLNHMPYFIESPDPREIRYPEWRPRPGSHAGLLCGHVHEKWKTKGLMVNVGVDQWEFAPILLMDAIRLLEKAARQLCPPTPSS